MWRLLIVSALMAMTAGNIIIPPPHPFAGEYPLTVFYSFGWREFANVEREMVTLTTIETSLLLCVGFPRLPQLGNMTGVEGKVVGYVFPIVTASNPGHGLVNNNGVPGCAYELMVSNCELAGCAGMVRFFSAEDDFLFNSPVVPQFWWSCLNCSYLNPAHPAIDFPVTQAAVGPVMLPLFYAILSPPNASIPPIVFPVVNVTMTSDISNFQYIGATFGLFAQVFLSLWALVNVVLAIYLLVLQLRRGKRQTVYPTLAITTLALEAWCNFCRLPVLLVDPFFAWGIYMPTYIVQIWISFFWSWSLIATFLIAFYWYRISFEAGRRTEFTSPKVLIPVILLSILLLCAEYVPLCIAIFSSVFIENTLLGRVIAESICYWAVSAFFIISGVRVLMILGRGASGRGLTRATRQQKSLARFVISLSALLTVFGAFLYANTTTEAKFTNGWYGINFVTFVFLLAISLLQILIFNVARKKTDETSGTTTNDSGSGSRSRGGTVTDGYAKVDQGCCGRRSASSSSLRTESDGQLSIGQDTIDARMSSGEIDQMDNLEPAGANNTVTGIITL